MKGYPITLADKNFKLLMLDFSVCLKSVHFKKKKKTDMQQGNQATEVKI